MHFQHYLIYRFVPFKYWIILGEYLKFFLITCFGQVFYACYVLYRPVRLIDLGGAFIEGYEKNTIWGEEEEWKKAEAIGLQPNEH